MPILNLLGLLMPIMVGFQASHTSSNYAILRLGKLDESTHLES